MAQPLSKSEWRQRKDRGNWSYRQYLDFWHSKNRPQQPTGPPGTMSQPQLIALANQLLPATQSTQQMRTEARTSVQSAIDPIIRQITDAIGRRSAAGSAAIAAGTNDLASRLGAVAPQVASSYDAAKREQAALDQALVGLAQGQGQSAYEQLAGSLGEAGAPAEAIAATAGQLPVAAQGQGQFLGGLGASTLSRLIAQGATEQTAASTLPAYGRALGQQGLADFQSQLNTMLADQTGELRAQVPGLVEQTYQSMVSRGDQNAAARASFVNEGLSRALSAWATSQGLGMDQSQLAENQRQFNASQAQQASQFSQEMQQRRKEFRQELENKNPKTWTPQDLASAQATAIQSALQNILIDPLSGGARVPPPKFRNSPYQYWHARVVSYLSGLLSGMPIPRPMILSLADRTLRTAGLTPKKPPAPTNPKTQNRSGP